MSTVRLILLVFCVCALAAGRDAPALCAEANSAAADAPATLAMNPEHKPFSSQTRDLDAAQIRACTKLLIDFSTAAEDFIVEHGSLDSLIDYHQLCPLIFAGMADWHDCASQMDESLDRKCLPGSFVLKRTGAQSYQISANARDSRKTFACVTEYGRTPPEDDIFNSSGACPAPAAPAEPGDNGLQRLAERVCEAGLAGDIPALLEMFPPQMFDAMEAMMADAGIEGNPREMFLEEMGDEALLEACSIVSAEETPCEDEMPEGLIEMGIEEVEACGIISIKSKEPGEDEVTDQIPTIKVQGQWYFGDM